jgi:hypothetical protein
MWLQALNATAEKAGFPTSIYTSYVSGTPATEAHMNITSLDPSIYGVRLSLNTVTVKTAIQSAVPSQGG